MSDRASNLPAEGGRGGRQARPTAASLQPRFRVLFRGRIALGPGKAELLRQLAETGSISEAARRMEMSYMRAWTLVKVMNGAFRHPLVTAARGGVSGGGAELTPLGRRALRLYLRIESSAVRAAATDWKSLESLLRG
jgi:molybdate transport system regulatory protein